MARANPFDESRHTEQVPRSKRFLWGLGGFTDASITYGLNSLVNVIYINALGVNAVLVSLACAVPRFLDFITDPLVGHLSDNTRSRWGRRRPWLLVGLLITAAVSVLLWHAPLSQKKQSLQSYREAAPVQCFDTDADNESTPTVAPPSPSHRQTTLAAMRTEWKTFLYLMVMMSLLYAVGYSLFNIPHYAMGYEMTTNYDERTYLFKWRFIAFAAAGFLTPWLMPLCMWFEGDQADILRGSQGVIPVSVLMAIVILATGLPSLLCRERLSLQSQNRIPFKKAVRMTLNNKPFWLLVGSNFIARFGMAVTGIFFYYVFVYHIGKGQQLKGVAFLAIFFNTINIANFLAMSPIAALSARIGKKPTLLIMLSMSALAYASLGLTFTNHEPSFLNYTLALGSKSWTLALHWPSLFTATLIGVFTNTMPMLTNSMIADICDNDELESGERREGFYGAVYTSVEKIALSTSLAFQGVLLVASGFDAALTLQTPETIRFWILALVITQPAGFLIGTVLLSFYPLTRRRMEEIRRQLDTAPSRSNA
ncbi:MFS transporter [candidate division KSB1 bacterium]|nr:MFS transporter [candidate division KSB1 bacterium]